MHEIFKTEEGYIRDQLIKLTFVNPPIPDRRQDWLAYPDGYEEDTQLQGWGKTPSDALRDLADVLEDEG